MCPYTAERNLVDSDHRVSGGKNEKDFLIHLPVSKVPVGAEELSGLMELNGLSVREKIDEDYGSLVGLCGQLQTSIAEGED
jgi:hypothetical protein